MIWHSLMSGGFSQGEIGWIGANEYSLGFDPDTLIAVVIPVIPVTPQAG